MKRIVLTLSIGEKIDQNSRWDNGKSPYLREYEIEDMDVHEWAEPVGDNYENFISVDKWIERKMKHIEEDGDWYIDPVDYCEHKQWRLDAIEIGGKLFIREEI